ncbi:uncharacterized protein CTRU02_200594 [Colletotrichum truncatum]|uniref:Integral membrane protein n=1 Tax=Colletotrichum truncatum TaxID=5467 RepID=A0ACC3ZFL6_COLTU
MQRTIWITTAGLFIIVTQATAQVTSRSSPPSTTELLSTTPGCAIPCFVEGYHTGNCTIGDLTDCICTNIPLQAQVSACVQKSCEFEDQVASAHISQQLCRGYPIPDRRNTSRIFSDLLPSISTAIVALRCIARLKVTSHLWWDDWTALVALVCDACQRAPQVIY